MILSSLAKNMFRKHSLFCFILIVLIFQYRKIMNLFNSCQYFSNWRRFLTWQKSSPQNYPRFCAFIYFGWTLYLLKLIYFRIFYLIFIFNIFQYRKYIAKSNLKIPFWINHYGLQLIDLHFLYRLKSNHLFQNSTTTFINMIIAGNKYHQTTPLHRHCGNTPTCQCWNIW